MVNAKRGGAGFLSFFFFRPAFSLVVGLGKLNCPRGLESGGYCFSYHFPTPSLSRHFLTTLPLVAAAAGALGCRIDGFLFIWRQDGTGLFATWGAWAGLAVGHYTILGRDGLRWGFETKEGGGDWRLETEKKKATKFHHHQRPSSTPIHSTSTPRPSLPPPIVFPVVSRDREEKAFAARGKMETMTLCVLGGRRREGRRQRGGGGE